MKAIREKGIWLAPLILAIVLWELVAVQVVKDPVFLPPFSRVIFSFYLLREVIILDILASLVHFSMGLALAFSVAFPLAICIGWFQNVFKVLDPIIEILRPIPPLAWIPFAIIWIGLNPFAAGFIIFIGAFFPILITSYTGFKDVPKILIDAGKVLGCTGDKKLIRYVALPYALPSVAVGTRVGMGVGWMCVVAAEIFGVGTYGLGFRIFNEFIYWKEMDFIVAYMLILGLVALVLDRFLRHFVENKLFKWKKGIVRQ